MTEYQLFLIYFLAVAKYVTSSSLNASCTVSNFNDVASAAQSCSTLTLKDIQIPEKTTMNIALKDGATLIFDGHITHVPVEWTGDLIKISGNNVHISGTSNHLLDGLGPKHWKGANEPTIQRPKFLRLQLSNNSDVKGLHLKNCPNACTMIQSSDTVISNILIDNRDGYPVKCLKTTGGSNTKDKVLRILGTAGTNYAKNTDGFDVSSSTNLRVKNSIIFNQDDCVAINGGSGLLFDNLSCNGSHGFSFSVRNGEVHNVEFRNSHMTDANIAIHIKTHNDGSAGKIYDVLYKNITFTGIERNAISIQQNYPKGEAKANIPITNLVFQDVKGKMTGSKSAAISIICAKGGCSDWTWSGVEISGAHNKNDCENVPSGIQC